MEFRVLGPVEVWSAGHRIDIGHAKQQSVLAVLLLELGRVVPIDLLIDRVWGDSPPTSVRNNLYAYVARLRSVFADADARARAGSVTLVRRSGGYLLEADAGLVDLWRFRAQVSEASAADDPRAAELLGGALGLWRGPALAGLTSPWLRGMGDTLEQQRIAALLDLGDIALRRGEHAAIGGQLATEAVAHPTDERLIGQLMLALYRSGRQAEALRWYEQTRRHLADELGADPEPALAELHQQILRSDPTLGWVTSPGSELIRPSWPGRPRWLRASRRPATWKVVSAGAALAVAVSGGVILGVSLAGATSSPAASTTAISGKPPPVPLGPVCDPAGARPSATAAVSTRPAVCLNQSHGSPLTIFTVRDSGFEPGTRVRLAVVFYPPPPPLPAGPRQSMTLRTLTVPANAVVRLGHFQLGVYVVVASGPGARHAVTALQVTPTRVG